MGEGLRQAFKAALRTQHEDTFAFQLRAQGIANRFTRQFHAIPGRKYAWDFAEVTERLLIEIQGQIWRKGGHTTGYGITRDAEKLNLATVNGWRTLIFTPEMIADGRALAWTREALGAK